MSTRAERLTTGLAGAGIDLRGSFGIRIEDLVVVDDDAIRILIQIPRALRIVD